MLWIFIITAVFNLFMTPGDGSVVEEDPRSELVARLLEYKKFKNAAEMLQEKEERCSPAARAPVMPAAFSRRRQTECAVRKKYGRRIKNEKNCSSGVLLFSGASGNP